MTLSTPSDYWNARYASGQAPWDYDGVPAELQAFLKRRAKGAAPGPRGRGRVLIPGCGKGHEIRAFAEAGYEVTAIDFNAAAVEQARLLAGPGLADRIQTGDFFTHPLETASFDLIYERAFLCAFPPQLRKTYLDRVASLLRHGGDLVGYFYYKAPDLAAGAPFGFAWGASDELFGRHFILLKDVPVHDSLPAFAGRERWQEQRRTAHQSS